MKNKNVAFVIATFLICLSSCTRYVADPDACYNDKVKQILISNCTSSGCHNPVDKEKRLDFTTYEGVMKAVKANHSGLSELYGAITSSGGDRMPPSYSLTQDEKDIIKHWINNGAKNNECYVSVCDTTLYTYSEIATILKVNCVGCHGAANNSAGVILDSYQNVVNEAKKGGAFLGSIKHASGYYAMPKFSSQLRDCEIGKIEKWISNGMPNN
ncbi:c-type cytochrome [Aurantibacillus circumpalustris]|uniref:c-type cytochrome n=1 Tax=Aurantibacillus circumpalustris TaxID=3036359 RepID=UPI00295A5DFC|nr:cytochrome c [Aurantibacillus circumpalustris]